MNATLKKELGRGLFHAIPGWIAWVLIHLLAVGWQMVGVALAIVGVTLFVVNRWRVHGKGDNWLRQWMNRRLVREGEHDDARALELYVSGFIIAWVLWAVFLPDWVIIIVPMLMAHVDPMSKLGMVPWIRLRNLDDWGFPGKSLGGAICGAVAGLLGLGMILLFHYIGFKIIPDNVSATRVAMVWLPSWIVAVFAELRGGKEDNLWIPTCSALMAYFMYAITMFFDS